MKRILFFACIACAAIVLTGCGEKSYSSGTVTFFGNVVDADTGLPLPVAQIEIEGGRVSDLITAVSTVTGSDGTYEVDVTLPAGEGKSFILDISVSKKGYINNSHSFSVTRDMVGKRIQQSFTIRK